MQLLIPFIIVTQTSPPSFHGSIREMIFHSGPMAKVVLLILLFFSVLSWAIIIDKFRAFRKIERENHDFLQLFRSKIGALDQIYQQTRRFYASPLAQLFRAGYRQILAEKEKKKQMESEYPDSRSTNNVPTEGEKERLLVVLDQASRSEVDFLERFLTFLATAGSVSPFIGLFGTVWGIMNSFRGLGIYGSASIGVVAPGISEALIATAAGLAAAIPAVMAYNYFLRRLQSAAAAMEDFSREFLGRVIP
ncbi:MotA/TolQ/ExbB proton channel family protein [candidate division CSSED10-310 bacterium]|uniref:MotA/TolQ/ExbB proton channel family protein n=1 Tax=candidate division CSSED10-310 bacterium TaxID=2855610 RepID=A0ABV6YV30_UNCC1